MKRLEKHQGFRKLPNGHKVFYRRIRPARSKGVLLIVHGMGDHLGRHMDGAQYFANEGWTVYLYDQRGHGKSPGIRSYCREFQEFVDDLNLFLQFLKKNEKGKKCFLFGHSFGGQVAINYLAQHSNKVHGAVLVSPNIEVSAPIPWIKRRLLDILALFLPTLRVYNEVNSNHLSHDPQVKHDYENDPLVDRRVTLGLVREMFNNQYEIFDHAPKIKTPCLFLHGEDDLITSPQATQNFFRKMKVKDKKLIMYPKRYHEIFNEAGSEKVYRDIENWLEKRG